MKPPREKLGSFFVDTASILIGDPCQFIKEPGEPPLLDWDRYVGLFEEQGTPHVEPAVVVDGVELIPAFARTIDAAHVAIEGPRGVNAGLAVMVGCDGFYPVYIERDEATGEPMRLVIELGGQVKP